MADIDIIISFSTCIIKGFDNRCECSTTKMTHLRKDVSFCVVLCRYFMLFFLDILFDSAGEIFVQTSDCHLNGVLFLFTVG
jgi:hypothetical protein